MWGEPGCARGGVRVPTLPSAPLHAPRLPRKKRDSGSSETCSRSIQCQRSLSRVKSQIGKNIKEDINSWLLGEWSYCNIVGLSLQKRFVCNTTVSSGHLIILVKPDELSDIAERLRCILGNVSSVAIALQARSIALLCYIDAEIKAWDHRKGYLGLHFENDIS